MDLNDLMSEMFCIFLILTGEQEANGNDISGSNEKDRIPAMQRLKEVCASKYATENNSCARNILRISPVENDTSSHQQIINFRRHLNDDHPGRLSLERNETVLQKGSTVWDPAEGHKAHAAAEVKANRSGVTSHQINKRDVIINNSTRKNTQKNTTSLESKLKDPRYSGPTGQNQHPPYYLVLGQNYGSHIGPTNDTDIDHLTGLHIALLLVACSGAIILLFINCVGILCCTRYFTRQQTPDTLLDTSFKTTESDRQRWRYNKYRDIRQNTDILTQSSFDDEQSCEEHIKLQTFPIKDHGAIAKTTPLHSDNALCKNCNVWL